MIHVDNSSQITFNLIRNLQIQQHSNIRGKQLVTAFIPIHAIDDTYKSCRDVALQRLYVICTCIRVFVKRYHLDIKNIL